MNIIAVDTSTEFASVGLIKENKIVSELNDQGRYSHNKKLFEMVTEVLKIGDLNISDIDIFAIGTGPGSFTGLRVGMSALKGLAFANNKKLIGVNSMDAIAMSGFIKFEDIEELNVIAEGRQKDFFYAKYSITAGRIKKIKEIIVLPYEEYSYIKGMTVGNVDSINIASENYHGGFYPKAEFIGKISMLTGSDYKESYDQEPEYYKNFKIRR